ncbi:hypothetical protein [Ammoniphilus sp. CFH 90114]|nr:hypothetical protein [Ammoniphilus sp. CFH 90114]
MKSQYCIDCGRELNEYISETLHVCNICETRKTQPMVVEVYFGDTKKV